MRLRKITFGLPLTVERMKNGNAAAPEHWRPGMVSFAVLGGRAVCELVLQDSVPKPRRWGCLANQPQEEGTQ